MHRLGKIATSPALYAGWMVLVVAALIATYAVDPYVYGFTVVILGGITIAVGLIGVAAALFSKTLSPGARGVIAGSVLIAGAAAAVAFAILGTFKWA